MSGIERPRIFETFFMRNPVKFDQGSLIKPQENFAAQNSQLDQKPAFITKYEKDTHEFYDPRGINGDNHQPEHKSAYTEVKNRYAVESEALDRNPVFENEGLDMVPQVPQYGLDLEPLRPQLREMFIKNRDFFAEYVDMASGAWGKLESQDPMKLWLRDDPDYLVFRSEVEINVPLETAVRYIQDEEFMKKVDIRRKGLDILKRESPDCILIHYSIDGKWPISPRDMVLYRCTYFSDKDNFQFLTFKAVDVDVPPPKGVVRADMKVQGSIFTRIGPSKTRYINCSMMNPRVTGVPLFVIRGKMKDAALISHQFKVAVEAAEYSTGK